MKIIDLLNKIANGEEIPKMIKYKSKTYSYDELERDYENYTSTNDWLFESYLITKILNDEVEIIEAPKKIEKLELESGKIDDKEFLAKYITHNRYKINELIDEINNLKEK